MSIYTYAGNYDPSDGTTALVVASGEIPLGDSGDITNSEFAKLSNTYRLIPGVAHVPISPGIYQEVGDESANPHGVNDIPGVASFNGRTGAVSLQDSDLPADFVAANGIVTTNATNDVIPAQIRINGSEVDISRPWGSYGSSSPNTDVTSKQQAIINYFAGAGIAGTTFYSQLGTWFWDGPQQTPAGAPPFGYSYTGQILFPANTNSGPHRPIRIRGCTPGATIGGNSSTPNGVIISSNCNAGKIIDVIPGYNGGPIGAMSSTCPILSDISILTINDPQFLGAVDFGVADKYLFEGNVNIYNQMGPATGLTGTGFGLKLPTGSNAGLCSSANLVVQGFWVGMILGEHAQFYGYTTVANCGIMLQGGGGHIPNRMGNFNSRGNLTHFSAPGAVNHTTIEGIFHTEPEGLAPGLQVLFNDPLGGAINGRIILHTSLAVGSMPSLGGSGCDMAYIPDSSSTMNNMLNTLSYMGFWMENHPSDNFLRNGVPTNPAMLPGLCCPSGHPYVPQSGNLAVTNALGGVCTISIATPAVVNLAGHSLVPGDGFKLSTTGSLPSGLVAGTVYYTYAIVDANNVQVVTTITPGGTCTISIGTPAVITRQNHGFVVGDVVQLLSTGALPTDVSTGSPLVAGQAVYVSTVVDVNNFQISHTAGGAAIATSGTQSGVQSVVPAPIPTSGTQSGVHTLTPISPHGTMVSTTASGTARTFLPTKRAGITRTETWRVTVGATQNATFYCGFIVGGANGNQSINFKLGGGNLVLNVLGTIAQTVTGFCVPGTTYRISLSVEIVQRQPIRARVMARQEGTSNTAPSTLPYLAASTVCDYNVTPTQQQNALPVNTSTAWPLVYDGVSFTNDTTTQVTYLNCVDGAPPDITGSNIVSVLFSGGGTFTPDFSQGSWLAVNVTDTLGMAVALPSALPSSTKTGRYTIEVNNSGGSTPAALTFAAGWVMAGKVWAGPASAKKRKATYDWNGAKFICSDVSTADYA